MRKLRPAEIARPDADALAALPRHPVSALLDNVRSLYNVGAMFRTADAARIERLYLSGYTGTPENPKLGKTALGAEETVPWQQADEAARLVRHLRDEGTTVLALEITDEPRYADELEPEHFPLCLVVGNEVHGVRDEVLDACSGALEIPQFGAKHSLNVATAFGIAAYDLVRRYRRLAGLPRTYCP